MSRKIAIFAAVNRFIWPQRRNRRYRFSMCKLFIIISLLGIWSCGIAQQDIQQNRSLEEGSKDAVCIVETMPSFPGGRDSLVRCIQQMIQESQTIYHGMPIYQFVINPDGSISDITVRNENDTQEDAIQYGIRIIERLPHFNPATALGNPIRCLYVLPINFDVYNDRIEIAKGHAKSSLENFVVFFTDAITKGVPVYSSDTSTQPIAIIQEHVEKEDWRDVEILEKFEYRYKVRIISCNYDSIATVEGWVDKEQCGVWLRGRLIEPGLWIVSLYNMPEQLNPFLMVSSKYPDDFSEYTDGPVPVLDYEFFEGVYWVKTKIYKGNESFIGWTRNYCPNIYCSCN